MCSYLERGALGWVVRSEESWLPTPLTVVASQSRMTRQVWSGQQLPAESTAPPAAGAPRMLRPATLAAALSLLSPAPVHEAGVRPGCRARDVLVQPRSWRTVVHMDVPLCDADLSPEQRAWAPESLEEAAQCWPVGWKVEVYAGGVHYTNGDDSWDWRSVALAARAYPGWRVELHSGARLSVYLPQART